MNAKIILLFLLFIGLVVSYKPYPVVALMICVVYLVYFVYETIKYKKDANPKEYKFSILKSVAFISIIAVLIGKIMNG